jgi:DNA modification methylase
MLATLPEASVHCCVTSPPYWGLRDYGAEGQLGLERTPDEYVANLVAVFREVRRVLRDDGTLWLTLGDSYAGGPAASGGAQKLGPNHDLDNQRNDVRLRKIGNGLKPKDLVGIPWRVAFALQADGWWLRSDIVWHKPNQMPESVTDRPTKSHEYVFLLSKAEAYYFDQEAVREPAVYGNHPRTVYDNGPPPPPGAPPHTGLRHAPGVEAGRNIRSVWTISTTPYSGAHFATFPPELPQRCIQAGTSERGCCPTCGAPWARIVEHRNAEIRLSDRAREKHAVGLRTAIHGTQVAPAENRTVGWRPACGHGGEPVPCAVLDPFAGTGTVGQVAEDLGRDSVLVEINAEYVRLIRQRTKQTGLFASRAESAGEGSP